MSEPHSWQSETHIVAASFLEAVKKSERSVKALLSPRTRYSIQSIEYVCEGEISPTELSMQGEDDFQSGFQPLNEDTHSWLKDLEEYGFRVDLEASIRKCADPEVVPELLSFVDQHGLVGHLVLEALGSYKLQGKVRAELLYKQFKKLYEELQKRKHCGTDQPNLPG
jgi:hypothetical protein